MQTRSVRAQLSRPPLFIIWPQLEGGFDGDFAGLASRSICEIEINSTRQKVQAILFEFSVAGISIRTCHKWETLRRIRIESNPHLWNAKVFEYFILPIGFLSFRRIILTLRWTLYFTFNINACVYTSCMFRICICNADISTINAYVKAHVCIKLYAMHMYLKSKLHLQNSMLLKLPVWRGIKGFCEGIKFTEANPSISWEIRCKNWPTLKFGRY